MFVDITAVLDDGTRPRGVTVPHDTRVAMRWCRGETVIVRVNLISPTGAPVTLEIGGAGADSMVLTARTPGLAPRQLFTASAVVAPTRGHGQHDITIAASVLAVLDVDRAIVDLWALRAGGVRIPLITSSALRFEAPAIAPP